MLKLIISIIALNNNKFVNKYNIYLNLIITNINENNILNQ